MGGLAEGRSTELAFLWGLLAGLGEMVGWLGLEDAGGGFGSLVEGKEDKKEGSELVGTPRARLWAEQWYLGVEVATYSHRAVQLL